MKKVIVLGVIFFMNTFFINCQTFYSDQNNNEKIKFKVKKSEKDWKDELTPKEFNILRNKGTERPYTGVYNMHFEKGIYECR
jgi:peptide-methionine (R)-S-oxide reductase